MYKDIDVLMILTVLTLILLLAIGLKHEFKNLNRQVNSPILNLEKPCGYYTYSNCRNY